MATPTSFLRIGHRGAAGYREENTLSSFAEAIDLGADMIELDVQLLTDDELAVIHDDLLDRTTTATGLVSSLSSRELAKIRTKGGERVPLLHEVLTLVDGRLKINVELKGLGCTAAVAAQLAKAIDSGRFGLEDFLVSSFHWEELRAMRLLWGDLPIAILQEYREPTPWAVAEELGAVAVNPDRAFVTKAYVEEAHRRNLAVYPYTVNTPEDIADLKAMGIDGAFSDYPDRL